MRPRPFSLLFILACIAGLVFSGYSTHDFVQHLDREVHTITCSFLPGLEPGDATGSSGCHVTLMSPYSSVFRAAVWGGIPISLPAMSVFAFLLFRGLDLVLNRREDERGVTGFLVAAAALPLLTSVVMGYLSLVELGATCKLCIGIYASSAVAFVSALLVWRGASAPRLGEDLGILGEPAAPAGPGMAAHVASFFTGVAFVVVPVLVYLISMPDYSRFVGTCGELTQPEDPYGVFVPIGDQTGKIPAIEVFDPLCPACKGFEDRLEASGLSARIARKAVMFPLDNTCNWMVGSAMHPGACAVSEGVLCAGDKADAVVEWAFEHQEEIRTAAAADPDAAANMVTAAFPELKSCVGSAKVRTRLNRSLRWAVANQLSVLTPQLFVQNKKLCDADTDLGLDYSLTRLVDGLDAQEAP